VYESGSIYEGEVHNDEPNGWGRRIHANYSYQIGNFVNGKYQSKKGKNDDRGLNERAPTMEHIENYTIEKAVNDKQNGYTVWSKDNNEYKGNMVNGLPDGYGTFIWANGNRYDGNWKEGKKHGYGVLYYENGAVYEGEFLNGERSGKGKLISPEGDTYKGTWLHNKMNGAIAISGPGKPSVMTMWKDDVIVSAQKTI
jgi:hypothetical protein